MRNRSEVVITSSTRSLFGNYVAGAVMLGVGIVFLASLFRLLVSGISTIQVEHWAILISGLVGVVGGLGTITEYVEVRHDSILIRSYFGLQCRVVKWKDVDRISLFQVPFMGVPTTLSLHHTGRRLNAPTTYLRGLDDVCKSIIETSIWANPTIQVAPEVTRRFGAPPYGFVPKEAKREGITEHGRESEV